MALGQGEIGQRIKQAREEAGLTQVELTLLIGLKHSQSVSNYERGIGEVPPKRLRLIAEVTKRPLSFFVAEPQDGEAPNDGTDQAQVVEAIVGAVERNQTALARIETAIAALLDAEQARSSQRTAGEHGGG